MINSHKEVFRVVPESDEDWVLRVFDSYENAVLSAADHYDRFRIEKIYVRR